MIKYCLGFMFNENKTDILLIEKQKPEWQKGLFNGIGGKLEKDESSLDAMVREFKEETGIDSKKSWWKYIITMKGDGWEADVFTTITDEVFYYRTIEKEKVNLIPLNELDKYPLISNIYWLIPICLDQINYIVTNRPND